MPERKVWTEDQDKILKLLREQRGQRKWANIARIMEQEFGLAGRTGKQCRERYHNHLDSSIVSAEWREDEEAVLYEMHGQIGNKWSLIAQKLPGRSDNCVKNHFYSKLRKSLRKLNKLVHEYFPEEFPLLKESVLSKIIKTTESKFKSSSKIDEELADFCNDIKNRLFRFTFDEEEEENLQDLQVAKQLLNDIQVFDRDYKKGYKGIKFEYDFDYLKPPPKTLKKHSSESSWSDRSQSSSISSMGFSSDLSDMEQNPKQSKTTEVRSGQSSCRHSQNSTVKSQGVKHEIDKCLQLPRHNSVEFPDMEMQYPLSSPEPGEGMKVESFSRHYESLVERDIDYYGQSNEQNLSLNMNNMYYDNTPVIARILAPPEMESLDFFGKEQHEELDEQMDRMEL